MTTGTVYLLHFDRRHPKYGWQHYIGWTHDLAGRIASHHRAGPKDGSRVSRECHAAGIGFQVARIWPGVSRAEELRMKAINGRNLCPFCLPGAMDDGHGGQPPPEGL